MSPSDYLKTVLSIIFSIILANTLLAQNGLPKYWISFTDKDQTPYSIEVPEEFISPRSVERRLHQGISITREDLPVNPEYLKQIRNKGIHIINVSKWFNGALIELTDTTYLDTLRYFEFIRPEIKLVKPRLPILIEKERMVKFKIGIQPTESDYGFSYNQIGMLNGDLLHRRGYMGEGILIAILDAGFSNANTISSLSHIWDDNKVIAWKDFVKDTLDIFNSHPHGTVIFSIMGGMQQGRLIGTAPNAEYVLVRTEDGSSEYLIEEYNWVCGAEFADSIGADVINTSLGYTQFDDPAQNHAYADLNGRTTPISIAATMAARKGIIVCTSASNLGDDPWFRIGAPADADSILAVGAVDSLGVIASFSSRGPAFDGRIKPDVVAQGVNTIGQHPNGQLIYCSGTSCSSPVIAGLTACLWQANPSFTNIKVMDAIRKSASQYFHPDSVYGYGIPDMLKADWMLQSPEEIIDSTLLSFNLFPNPASDRLYLYIFRPDNIKNELVTLKFLDLTGRIQRVEEHRITGQQYVLEVKDISQLPTGLYIIEITLSDRVHSLLFSKG